jgi:hypothetical protein
LSALFRAAERRRVLKYTGSSVSIKSIYSGYTWVILLTEQR